MKYLSICSGIEAATVAWHPLGWEPVAFSEIEAFPAAVLAHHYPAVPNLGDMTKIKGEEYRGTDVLVGGTPCQAFSVAGLRRGLVDPRGNLTLTFAKLADDMQVHWVVWENVPGVLSSKDNAFGCFLGLLAGEADALVAPGGKWTNAGFVLGPQRAIAWRVLDAQYFGVAQRRRRVFVVACPRNGADPREVLFEFQGVRRDSAPSREKGKGFAGNAASGVDFRGVSPTLTNKMQGSSGWAPYNEDAHLVPVCADGGTAKKHGPGGLTSIQHMLSGYIQPHVMAHGQGNAEIVSDGSPSLTCNHEAPIAFTQCVTGPITHALKADGFDGSEDGTGRGQPVIAIQERAICENPMAGPDGVGVRDDGCAYTLEARTVPQAVAFAQNQLGEVRTGHIANTLNTNSNASGRNTPCVAFGGDLARTLQARHDSSSCADRGMDVVAQNMQVRRLTPVECERLQGFPDNYTAIPWRNKPAEDCPDGPRYKALGNSMAVPCMRWIGQRIADVACNTSMCSTNLTEGAGEMYV